MSEYMERFSVSRLIGAPPGYVGYDEGGVLTDAVRRRPYQLVLLDEFEKAHREVSNLLLQVFDEGRLTDSQGRVVDFRNTVIIMTSNLGSDILAKFDEETKKKLEEKKNESANESDIQNEIKHRRDGKREIATKMVHQHFSPEFVNRLDDVIVFNSLTVDGIMKICTIQLNKVKQLLKDKQISFHFSPAAAEQIALSGSNLQYGARPLKRLIQNEILSPLASKMLSGEIKVGDELFISIDNDSQSFVSSIYPDRLVDAGKSHLFKLELSKETTEAVNERKENESEEVPPAQPSEKKETRRLDVLVISK